MALNPDVDIDADSLHDRQYLIVHGGLLLAHAIVGDDEKIAEDLELRNDESQLGIAFFKFTQFVLTFSPIPKPG